MKHALEISTIFHARWLMTKIKAFCYYHPDYINSISAFLSLILLITQRQNLSELNNFVFFFYFYFFPPLILSYLNRRPTNLSLSFSATIKFYSGYLYILPILCLGSAPRAFASHRKYIFWIKIWITTQPATLYYRVDCM